MPFLFRNTLVNCQVLKCVANNHKSIKTLDKDYFIFIVIMLELQTLSFLIL